MVINAIPAQIITSSNFSLNDQTAKELTDMAHQGIKLLTNWTTAVMELVCIPGWFTIVRVYVCTVGMLWTTQF